MINFILMLLGLAFSSNNATTYNDNQYMLKIQNEGTSNPTTGTGEDGGPGNGGSTGGNTGQNPPPFTNP